MTFARTLTAPLPHSRIRRGRLAATSVLLTLLLSGCASLHTSYERPQIAVPAHWSVSEQESHEIVQNTLKQPWWQHFGDERLDHLINLALHNNNDLVQAAWNIRQAQITLGLADNRSVPTLSASGSTGLSHSFEHSNTSHSYSGSVNVSYEVDLWGAIASQQSAAAWRLAATREDLQSTAIALVANVSTLYWQLAWHNEQIANGLSSLAYVRRTQALVTAQYEAGAVSDLEVQEAARTVATQEAALTQLRQNRITTRNALAVLLNLPPSSATFRALLPTEPETLADAIVPEVPAGVPAQVLARRPDLQAAESRLRASLAEADATRASYYPTLNLTGGMGVSSSTLSDFFTNPIGTLAANLALPFLHQGEMHFNNAAARARYEVAVANFRHTLVVALQEVEDALTNRQHLSEQGYWLQQQLNTAERVEALNEVRYRAGATPLRNWLDAQEARRNAYLALVGNRFDQLSNQLTLYKALGGDATVFKAPPLPDVAELARQRGADTGVPAAPGQR